MLRVGGIAGDGGGIEPGDVDVHAPAGMQEIDRDKAGDQSDGGDNLEVDQRLDSHTAHFAQVSHARDADHHGRKDDGRQRHADEQDEGVAQWLQGDGEAREQRAENDAEHDSDQDLEPEGPEQGPGLAGFGIGIGDGLRNCHGYSASCRITRINSALPSKPMPGQFRHGDVAVLHADAVRETAERLEEVGVALVAAKAQAGGDVQRHLVAAVRNAAARRPSGGADDLEGAQILAQAVGERAVELQPVAVRAHAAVAQQVARILMAEEVFAGGHGSGVELGERGLQRKVERVARLLVPEERIVAQHLGVGDRGLEIEAAIGVHGELGGRADLSEHRLDTLAVVGEFRAADLHLDDGVPAVQVAAHLGAQRG